jgi:hypothetical protein
MLRLTCPKCKKNFVKKYRTKYCSKDCYLEVARKDPNKGCFSRGHRPFNKGTKGLMKPNKTTFRKGNVPQNHKHLSSITIRNDKCGTRRRWIKIKEPKTWIEYARYVWLKSGRKIKEGYVVGHKDADSLNDSLKNLVCVSKEELPKIHNKWNTKNAILNEPKQLAYRYKRALKLRAVDFIRGQSKERKVARFKRFSKCIKIVCERCNRQIETCVLPNPMATLRQRMDVFIEVHNRLSHPGGEWKQL